MIYNHENYRSWLDDELKKRKKDNPLLSTNTFAKKLGVSQALLSLILGGKRKLTPRIAQEIGSKLNLTENELNYLMLIIASENAHSPEQRRFYKNELKKFKVKNSFTKIDLDKFDVISEWHHSAILEIIRTNDFDGKVETISSRLGIEPEMAEEALKKLEKLKLIKKEKKTYVRLDDGFLDTPSDIGSKALRNLHKEILKKASDALETQALQDRHISGMTMAIDPTKLPKAKEMIQNFTEELMEYLESGDKQEVYHISLSLFSLETKRRKK